MTRVRFNDFTITENEISCVFVKRGKLRKTESPLYFKLSHAHRPHDDIIALALSTLFGKAYDDVHIDLPVSEHTLSKIHSFTGIRPSVKSITSTAPTFPTTPNKVTLNFSGGLDSLSVKALLPDDISLVSLDYGGLFARERVFFEEFSPYIVTTNLVDLKLNANTGVFMGIASLLYKELLGTDYHAFGTPLEDLWSQKNWFFSQRNFCYPTPFIYAGIRNLNMLSFGMLGTTMALLTYRTYPELLEKSLKSLANVGDSKLYQKQLFLKVFDMKYKGIDFTMDGLTPPITPFNFGETHLIDLFSLYFVKYVGMEAAQILNRGIPESYVAMADSVSLDFMEKLNPQFLPYVPHFIRDHALDVWEEAGIQHYSAKDWKELYAVLEFLSQWHPHLRPDAPLELPLP
ncbi:MAG: hypothetical protein LBG99_07060 [Propionibacteriaceae bacterium]|jgi:hypothetical protein|nr:hypothetical protein [Propionibacteriaceae bacterium]